VAIRPPLGDLYEELGVARGATRDEISAAYRTRAKELHPDACPDDGTAADRFTRLGAAYRVLSNPEERARYDAALERPVVTGRRPPPSAPAPARAAAPAPAPAATPPKPFRLSPRNARWAAWGGAGLVVLGLVVGGFVFSLQQHDADLEANGVATTATVIQVNGERRLEFETSTGRVVRATESVKTGEEQPAVGSKVKIHYDRSDPTSIVTDESHTARNITLWIVAIKLVIGGAVLAWFGFRRLRLS
jgi:DnaJ domain/Protein of unknown function (DUF3592)